MRRVNSFTIVPRNDGDDELLRRLLDASASLWNQLTYERRQNFTDPEIDKSVWETEDYRKQYVGVLGSATAQQVIRKNNLFPWRTARGNIAFGLEQRGVPEAEREQRVRELLELVGLEEFADAYPKELSGGMKQRVGIARALAVDPELLLMDEPFGAVDAQTRAVLQDELLDLWGQTGKTVLFVTHDVEEAVKLADRIVVMGAEPGRVKAVVDIDLERPRSRADAGFGAYYERVLDLIRG